MQSSRLTTHISCAFLAVALAATARAEETKIELPNSGFEQGLAKWIMREGNNAAYSMFAQPDAFAGKSSAQILLNENSTPSLLQAAYIARRDLPTEVGYYRLSFQARTELTKGIFGTSLIALDEAGKTLMSLQPGSDGAMVAKGSTPWHEMTLVYRVPANTKTTILQLQAMGALGAIGIDEVGVTRLDDATGKALMKEMKIAPTLEDAGAKRLDAPCRVINARLGTLYTDPVNGRVNLAINSCTPGQGSGLLIDYQVNKSTVIPFPSGAGGWDLIQTAPDRMLFESLGNPTWVVPVDLKTRALAPGMAAVKDNSYAWSFAKGPDDWVYMGSYPSAHLYRYNTKTFAVEDMGLMGPEGNLYNRYVGATSDGWVLSSMMMDKSGVVAFNPKTKDQYFVEGVVDADGKGVSPSLNDVGGVAYATFGGRLHQFDTAQKKFVPALLPAPPGDAKWIKILASSTPQRKVVLASDKTYYVIEAGKAPLPVWNLDLRGGTVVGVDEKNRVIGFRGQDYFVGEPMATEIKPQLAASNPPPVGIHFLRADPKGGVTGGPNFGQTLFRFDPKRALLENTPQVLDTSGEVYDGRWVDGKFYFIAYAGGDLAVWDPAKPWDQWSGQNPRLLHSYHGVPDGELIRPIGGLVVGPRGRLFSAWSAKYGKMGGGLGEFDIATGKSRSWTNEMFAPDMAIGHITADDKYIYGVTSNSFSGITPPKKTLTFWVFDPVAEKIVFSESLPNATERPALQRVPQTGNIWLAEPAGLRCFDPKTLSWKQTLSWPEGSITPQIVSASDARGSHAWFTAGEVVVRVDDDGAKPVASAIFSAPELVGSLAAGDDEQLYFTQGVEVWSAPQVKG